MVQKIWEILNTLTEDAKKTVLAKCRELSFDPNKGEIPLEESFINLNATRLILVDAIEKEKLVQLPLTVQKTLLRQLETIIRLQTELTGGADQVINLVEAIETLHYTVWQYRLPHLTDEVLGFETKMNQLKSLDLEVLGLKGELEAGLALKTNLQQLFVTAGEQSETIQRSVTTSAEAVIKVNGDLAAVTEATQKAAAFLATIQQYDTTSSQVTASAKTSSAEVSALESKIKEFFSQVDQYRLKITSTTEDAQSAVQLNKTQTGDLITKLGELEDQIKVQIQKATGHSLFHSFQTRQESLVKSKRFWLSAIAALIGISLLATVYLINSVPQSLDTAFYLKLTITLPIIFLITFCTLQYSRERRLEEEYAFKANISISLIPYQELVEKLTDKSAAPEREKYSTFIIESISKVFSSPTDRVFGSGEPTNIFTQKSLTQVTKLLEAVAKAGKP